MTKKPGIKKKIHVSSKKNYLTQRIYQLDKKIIVIINFFLFKYTF